MAARAAGAEVLVVDRALQPDGEIGLAVAVDPAALEELPRSMIEADDGRTRESGPAHHRVVLRADRAHDVAVRVDPDAAIGKPERAPELASRDGGRSTGAARDRAHDPPRHPAPHVGESPDRADAARVGGQARRDARRREGPRPIGPWVGGCVLPRIADTAEVGDRVGGVPAVPHVFDVLGVATVRRRVERLDHGAVIRDDLPGRADRRRDPAVTVGPDLLVPPDVDLVARTVEEVTVAIAPEPVPPDLVGGERPGGDGLRPQRLGRPAARHLPHATEVLLERELERESFHAAVRAPGEIELEEPVGVREALVPDVVGFGHERPCPGAGERHEQRPRGAPPSGATHQARRSRHGPRTCAAPVPPTPSTCVRRGPSPRTWCRDRRATAAPGRSARPGGSSIDRSRARPGASSAASRT